MQNVRLEDLIVIDIETVPLSPGYEQMDEHWQGLWREKAAFHIQNGLEPAEAFGRRAGVMAEFSKIVCISMGYFYREDTLHFKIKSFASDDEKALLSDFLDTLKKIEKHYAKWYFAGHNVKEFDVPFLCRRLLINQLPVPPYLDFQNMKPWETNILDTFHYWRFGDFKNFTSLKLLAACLGVPCPKDDIDGSMVAGVYWQEKNLQRIVEYCQKDVATVANIILRFKRLPLLEANCIHIS